MEAMFTEPEMDMASLFV